MKYNVTNIQWYIDKEEFDDMSEMTKVLNGLPSEVTIDAEDEESIADALSDEYGFLVDSFNID